MNTIQTNPTPQPDTANANLTTTPTSTPVATNGETPISGGQSQQQPAVTLTIRLIMQGKEVGSIIGKKGDNIKRFREESGAKITISDGNCPERIVTITGSTDSILRAFTLIARKFEEANALFQENQGLQPKSTNGTIPTVINGGTTNGSSPGSVTPTTNGQTNGTGGQLSGVTLKLIIPASQCGSLIGKAGAKIKEIREMTGANIQVASDMLPNSTERAVTLTGNADSITKSVYQISCVMLESPPKGPTIPYRPKPAMPPVFFAGGQAYTIQGQFAIPHPDPYTTGHHTPHLHAHNYHLHQNIHQNYHHNTHQNLPVNGHQTYPQVHPNSYQNLQQPQPPPPPLSHSQQHPPPPSTSASLNQQVQQHQAAHQQQQQQLNAAAAAAAAAAFFESSQSCALQHQAAAAYLNHQLNSAHAAANIQQAVAASMAAASLVAASTGNPGSVSSGLGLSIAGPNSGSSQSSSTSGGANGGPLGATLNGDALIGGGGSPVDESGFFHHLHHSLHSAAGHTNGGLHSAGTNGQMHSPASQSPGLEHLHSMSASPNSAALAAAAVAASVGDFSTHFASNSAFLTKLHRLALQHAPLLPGQTVTSGMNHHANLASLANSVAIAAATANGTAATNLGANVIGCGSGGNAAPSSSSSSAAGMVGASSITAEMTIPNDIIGCVIGKGGSKINEIRQLSGASIKISSNGDDSKERVVIISGTAEAINLAQYLIATRTAAILQGLNQAGQNMVQMKSLPGQAAAAVAAAAAAAAYCGGQHAYAMTTHHNNHHAHPQQQLPHHHHHHSNNRSHQHPSVAPTTVIYR